MKSSPNTHLLLTRGEGLLTYNVEMLASAIFGATHRVLVRAAHLARFVGYHQHSSCVVCRELFLFSFSEVAMKSHVDLIALRATVPYFLYFVL